MSGIIHKIGETLHVGGHKKEEEHKGEHHAGEYKGEHHGEHSSEYKGEHHGEHKAGEYHGEHKPEHKEGFLDKVKDKIHGEGGAAEGEKKKKENGELANSATHNFAGIQTRRWRMHE